MFQLLLLGEPVLLSDAAEPVPVWRPALALLALTAGVDESVTRERAAGLLWPELDEAKARRALRQVLFRVRRDAGELLIGDRTTIRRDRRLLTTDVAELERDLAAGELARAVAGYRGDFLTGFSLRDSSAFDHWADGRRQRLRSAASDALEALVDQASAAGDWSGALRHARRRLDVEPLSEAAAARVLSLLYQCGDRAGALALYERVTARFVAELGAAPAGELASVARRIRSEARPTDALRPATVHAVPGAAPVSAPAAVPAAPFHLPLVGRAREFEQLIEQWNHACAGERQVVVLAGEEGVGKTRLADDFTRWAVLRGATALWSRAYEIERQIPYALLAGALRATLSARGLAGVDARTPRELGRIVPEFAARFPQAGGDADSAGADPARADSGGIGAGRLRVLEAVRDVIDTLAFEAPVLLVADDVQWGDEASLAALNYVCRTLPASPLLLLLTVRTAELVEADPVTRLLHGLGRETGANMRRLRLAPLDEGAIADALVRLGVPRADAGADATELLLETGGNPLFLTELLRDVRVDDGATRPLDGPSPLRAPALHAAGPARASERLSALAADRLLRLPDPARRLLEASAVLGRQFALRLAAVVANLDVAAASTAIELLLRRGLLRQVSYGYDFGHGLLRRELIESIGTTRLVELHAAVYAQLEPAGDTPLDEIGVERANALAHHAARGGLHEAAHRWYLHAADRAIHVYAGEEAEAALRSALAHAGDRARERATHVQLGQLAWIRSEYAQAARAYRRALELCDDPAERLRLRIRLLDSGLRGGILSVRDADELAPVLLDEADAAGPQPLRDLLLAVADAYGYAGRHTEAVACGRRAVDAARAAAEPASLVRALLLLARHAAHAEEPTRPLACLEEAVEIARGHGLERERLDARIELATELSRIGRWDAAITELRDARAEAQRCGAAGAEMVAAINLSDLLVRRGEWDEAAAVLHDGEQLSGRHDFPHASAAIRMNRALLAWLRGDAAADIVDAAERAADAAARVGLRAVERAACAVLVLHRLDAGDGAGADLHVERMRSVAPAAHANWAGDQELALVADARVVRASGAAGETVAGLDAALRAAVSACGAALLRLELAYALEPQHPRRARRLRADAVGMLRALGAEPLARRLAGDTL
jgi:DNA-binding SARP family transcriptional activator/tetratricopeptide (TPR) repeat protein